MAMIISLMNILPNLLRIGNDKVAVHAFTSPEGVTVIDAGLAGHYKPLLRELAANGFAPRDIKAVILTHGDTDHIGFAERLRAEHGTTIYVHEADAERAKGNEKTKSAFGPFRLIPTLGFLFYAAFRGGGKTRFLTEVTTFRSGETINAPGDPVIIGVPGHSPGSVAIYLRSAGAVFVGDALTTRNVLTGEEGAAPAPFTDDPALANESLASLDGLDVELIVPGHGAPFTGSVAELQKEYRSRI